MVLSLATYIYASLNNGKDLDKEMMFVLAIADIFIAGAIFSTYSSI